MTSSTLRLRSLSGPEPESGVSGSDSELSDARLQTLPHFTLYRHQLELINSAPVCILKLVKTILINTVSRRIFPEFVFVERDQQIRYTDIIFWLYTLHTYSRGRYTHLMDSASPDFPFNITFARKISPVLLLFWHFTDMTNFSISCHVIYVLRKKL